MEGRMAHAAAQAGRAAAADVLVCAAAPVDACPFHYTRYN